MATGERIWRKLRFARPTHPPKNAAPRN
jgi:hypothetical protein